MVINENEVEIEEEEDDLTAESGELYDNSPIDPFVMNATTTSGNSCE